MPAKSRWYLIQGLKGKDQIGITGTVHEDQYTFLIISQIKVAEKVETRILCSTTSFSKILPFMG
jgi:hypothetical protein